MVAFYPMSVKTRLANKGEFAKIKSEYLESPAVSYIPMIKIHPTGGLLCLQ
jgi:hypothetical protein